MALVTRADVVRFAKVTGALSPDQQTTVDDMILAATPIIESLTGRAIETASRSHVTSPRSGALVLPWPFTSVTSVTLDGVTIPAPQYDAVLGAAAGILYPAAGYNPWASGQAVTVVVGVGSGAVPPQVREAALELLSYWWASTQQAQRALWTEGTPMGFGIPQRVRDLLATLPPLVSFG